MGRFVVHESCWRKTTVPPVREMAFRISVRYDARMNESKKKALADLFVPGRDLPPPHMPGHEDANKALETAVRRLRAKRIPPAEIVLVGPGGASVGVEASRTETPDAYPELLTRTLLSQRR